MGKFLALEFGNQCVFESTKVKVYLTNGICLEGVFEDHDDEAIVLMDSHRQRLLIFKSAISTIKPQVQGR